MPYLHRTLGIGSVLTLVLLGGRAVEAADTLPVLRAEHYGLDLSIDFETEKLSGSATIRVRNASEAPAGQLSFLLYRLLTVRAVMGEDGSPLQYRQQVVGFTDAPKRQTNHVLVELAKPLPPDAAIAVTLSYDGFLLGYSETNSRYIKDRIDEAFTIIREDADAYPTLGVPSFDRNRAQGLPRFDYDARITVPTTHVVANVGQLVERVVTGHRATYAFRNIVPAWRMDFAIAKFGVLEDGVLRVFHLQDDADGAARVLRAMRASLELFTFWFGPPPTHGRTLTVIEIPDGWGSQTDVTGILQTAAVFKDARRQRELYHEVSHLWHVPLREAPSHRWDEGLASFLEVLAAERLNGEAKADRLAAVLKWLKGRLEADPALSRTALRDYGRASMTDYSYSVGMLFFYLLHERMGESSFNAAIGRWSRQFGDVGATTAELIAVLDEATPAPLQQLIDDWIRTTHWTVAVRSANSLDDLGGGAR